MRRHRLRRVVPVLVGAVVVAGSLVPLGGDGGATVAGVDTLLHGVGYAVLAASVAWATPRAASWRTVAVALLVAIGLGIAVEVVQGPLPTRHTSAADAVANAAGALVGAAGWWLWSRRFDWA